MDKLYLTDCDCKISEILQIGYIILRETLLVVGLLLISLYFRGRSPGNNSRL